MGNHNVYCCICGRTVVDYNENSLCDRCDEKYCKEPKVEKIKRKGKYVE
ncbi:hypothetical protein [Bacillus phage YungSlug]|nr:hypothetical protein [Bacillus phage YungSlug]